MPNKVYLATLSILVEDRHRNIEPVNKLLTQYGYLVIARLGVSVERRCLKGCRGLITVVVEGTKKEIQTFAKELNNLKQTKVKTSLII